MSLNSDLLCCLWIHRGEAGVPGSSKIWQGCQDGVQKVGVMMSSPRGSDWWAAARCHSTSLGASFSQVLLVCATPGLGRGEAHPLFSCAAPALITALFVTLKWNWISSFENWKVMLIVEKLNTYTNIHRCLPWGIKLCPPCPNRIDDGIAGLLTVHQKEVHSGNFFHTWKLSSCKSSCWWKVMFTCWCSKIPGLALGGVNQFFSLFAIHFTGSVFYCTGRSSIRWSVILHRGHHCHLLESS